MCALVLVSPTVFAGLGADDWLLRVHLDPTSTFRPAARYGPLLGLFEFFPTDRAQFEELRRVGVLPWWTGSDTVGIFFRPLSALTHLFDWRVVGARPALHHLHSLAWLTAAIFAAGAFFRAWLGPGRAAALATLVFAVDDAHALPAGWMANRNALLAVTFTALAARAHLAAQRGDRGARWNAALWLLAALCSAEAGTAALVVLAALEIGRSPDAARWGPRWAPLIGVAVVWAGVWTGLDFGIRGSGLYLDPVSDPPAFVRALPERLGALSAAAWFNLPVDGWMLLPSFFAGVAGVGLLVVSAAAVGVFVGPEGWRDRRLVQASLIAVVALVPPAAAFPMTRLVGAAQLGVAALVGVVVARGLDRRRDRLAVFWHVPLAAALLLAQSALVPTIMRGANTVADLVPDGPAAASQHLVLVQGMEIATAYLPMIRALDGRPGPASVVVVGPVATAIRVIRLDQDTLEVRAPEGAFRCNGERLCRSAPFVAGERVTAAVVTVTVSEVDAAGFPLAWVMDFDRSLEDPSLLWRLPEGFSVREWTPPPVGSGVDLPALLPI